MRLGYGVANALPMGVTQIGTAGQVTTIATLARELHLLPTGQC